MLRHDIMHISNIYNPNVGNMSGKLELGVESTSPNFAKLTVLLRGIAHTWPSCNEGLPVWYACQQVHNDDGYFNSQHWCMRIAPKGKHKTEDHFFPEINVHHVENHWYKDRVFSTEDMSVSIMISLFSQPFFFRRSQQRSIKWCVEKHTCMWVHSWLCNERLKI